MQRLTAKLGNFCTEVKKKNHESREINSLFEKARRSKTSSNVSRKHRIKEYRVNHIFPGLDNESANLTSLTQPVCKKSDLFSCTSKEHKVAESKYGGD